MLSARALVVLVVLPVVGRVTTRFQARHIINLRDTPACQRKKQRRCRRASLSVYFLAYRAAFQKQAKSFEKIGGDDDTRTRDLCRDRVAGRRNSVELNGTDSPFLVL